MVLLFSEHVVWPLALLRLSRWQDCEFMPQASMDHAVQILHLLRMGQIGPHQSKPRIRKKGKITGLPLLLHLLEPKLYNIACYEEILFIICKKC